ncbi:MAG: BtpA/SgcQ family protein [Planctomycetes bacterium]|nr:BtpA/SgcQ family protein [Planctomycetota bacterium]
MAKKNNTSFEAMPPKALIGMVHVGALPGSPFSRRSLDQIEAVARQEARVLVDSGFDAIIVENMHDRPYVNGPHSPATVAAMTRLCGAVKDVIGDKPMGVQVLSSGEKEALAVALATSGSFIRCENFVYAHVADEGLLAQAAAGPLLRFRREIGAERIRIICDIKKKHASHAITTDISLGDAAHSAEFFGADGVIVTGAFTGAPADEGDVAEARAAVKLPVWVGSGVGPEQVPSLFEHADALIVGSYIKRGGTWDGPIDPKRCRAIVKARRT